jgi:glycosyltransferase involved in cell wall biosynthesis
MNVLHVITTVGRGGAESHLLELVRGQRVNGWGVSVAYLRGDGYWTTALEALGAQVHPLKLQRYGDLAPLWRLRRLMQELRPAVVHAHLQPAELYARLAMIGSSPAPTFIISKHNDEPFFRGPGAKVLGKWVARRACHIIAISDAVKRYVSADLGLSEDRISTIHYGINPAAYQSISSAEVATLRSSWLGRESKGWLIGTVARLVPQKALHVMLEAYAAYRKRASLPSRLVIVGQGPLEQELKAFAARLGLGGKVVWAGFREDIPTVMTALDLFALSSIYEGFGLVLIEAMSARKPVVASAVSAIPEVVADGRTGVLVPPRDAGRIAEAFLRFETESLREDYGRAGHERALEHFTLDKMVGRTSEIYARCLGGAERSRFGSDNVR